MSLWAKAAPSPRTSGQCSAKAALYRQHRASRSALHSRGCPPSYIASHLSSHPLPTPQHLQSDHSPNQVLPRSLMSLITKDQALFRPRRAQDLLPRQPSHSFPFTGPPGPGGMALPLPPPPARLPGCTRLRSQASLFLVRALKPGLSQLSLAFSSIPASPHVYRSQSSPTDTLKG